jgi:hypothetical protein
MERLRAGLAPWVRRDWLPEALIVLLGIALRVLVWARFDPRWGYDAASHLHNVAWYRDHATLPSLYVNREAYMPPLFYVLEALVLRALGHGQSDLLAFYAGTDLNPGLRALQWLPLVAGAVRLGLSAILLRRLLPDRTWARGLGLALLALLPAAVQLDVTVFPETLNTLFAVATMLAMVTLVAHPDPPLAVPVALGASLGLALLSKQSAMVLLAAAIGTAILDVAARPARARLDRARPWLVAGVLVAAISGWFYLGNVLRHGTPTPHPFELPGSSDHEQYVATGAAHTPYWLRRSPGYYLGWDDRIFALPYYPVASRNHPRFWPVLMASTFVDHYNFGFGRDPDGGRLPADRDVNGWPVRASVIAASRWSMAGGCLIALTCVVGLVLALPWLWRRRDVARLGVLAVPLLTVLAQLHFATKYPVDTEGMVKGVYCQLAAVPMAALFGIGVTEAWRRRWSRPLVVLDVLALLAVLFYVATCVAAAWGVRAVVAWS